MKIPYPLRATRIGISLMPFGFFGIIPSFVHRRGLTEAARQSGETIWFWRWAWFQIEYSRWV